MKSDLPENVRKAMAAHRRYERKEQQAEALAKAERAVIEAAMARDELKRDRASHGSPGLADAVDALDNACAALAALRGR